MLPFMSMVGTVVYVVFQRMKWWLPGVYCTDSWWTQRSCEVVTNLHRSSSELAAMVVCISNVTIGPASAADPPASGEVPLGVPESADVPVPGLDEEEPDEQAARLTKAPAASSGNARRIMKAPFGCPGA